MQVCGGNDQIARLPVQECLRVELGCRSTSAVGLGVDTAGRRGVTDVEQRELHADLAATNWRRWGDVRCFAAGVQTALPDTEQQVLTDRVQIARVAGDLQLTHDLRRGGIAKIKNVERIGL